MRRAIIQFVGLFIVTVLIGLAALTAIDAAMEVFRA